MLPLITLTGEEKLIPLTQCSLLVENNLMSSCRNSKKMQTVALFFVVEPKHLFLELLIPLLLLRSNQ